MIATVRLDGQPRDAVLAGGSLWVADYEGRVLQVDPVRRRVRARIDVGGTPLAVAAEGDRVLVVSNDSTPGLHDRSRLTTLDARTGRVVTSAPFAGYTVDLVAFGAGGLWRSVHSHGADVERLDLDTLKRTALITDTDVFGIAATERSLWTREPNTLSEWDASGRLVNRLRGLSLPIGRPSERTLLPDADGAWVVGQSGGLLYRVERGRVVRRVKVGQTAGIVARAGPAVWVSATPAPDTYELVRVDPDDGKVTGRMRLGWRVPQVIVPVGKRLWVITSGGDAILVSPE